MAKNSVVDTDHGFKELVERVAEAAKSPWIVSVGIHEAEGDEEYDDGETLLDVAEKHEFGLGVPRRSFIADWADESESENKRTISKIGKLVISGQVELEDALNQLGLKFVGDIQKRIKAGIDPANSEATIARKGSSTPLIDTGQLWSAIRHEVRKQ